MKTNLIIGSRSSDLALWQAHYVKDAIERKNRGIAVEIKRIQTKGDKIIDVALSKIGDKGLFTKEIENELLSGSIDIAVHSLKDLETKIPEGLKLSVVTKRHNVEDVLIARDHGITIDSLRENAVIATGSLRRRSQLQHLRPDIKVIDLRGNVPTRINRFVTSDWDAIILACAGVERLKLEKHISSYIPVTRMLPAVGQGALGIEIKENNQFANDIIQPLHHEDTYISVTAERSLLAALQGGCQVPIGAYAQVESDNLSLAAMVGTLDGRKIIRRTISGSKKEPEQTGKKLAQELNDAGAGEILKAIYNSNG